MFVKSIYYLCVLFGLSQAQRFTYGDLSSYNVTQAGRYSAYGTFLQQPGSQTGTVTFGVDPAEKIWYYGREYSDGSRTQEWFTPEGYYEFANGECTFDEHPNWTELMKQINIQQLLTREVNGHRMYSGFDPDYFGGISGVLRVLRNNRITMENWMYYDNETSTSYLNMYTRHSSSVPDIVYEPCVPDNEEGESEAPATEAPVTATPTATRPTPTATRPTTPTVTVPPTVTATPTVTVTSTPQVTTKKPYSRHYGGHHYSSKNKTGKKGK